MEVIKIYVNDFDAMDKYEATGIGDPPRPNLIDFYFDEASFEGMWIDPNVTETQTKDIIFYVGKQSFRTPYTEKRFEKMINILEHKKVKL